MNIQDIIDVDSVMVRHGMKFECASWDRVRNCIGKVNMPARCDDCPAFHNCNIRDYGKIGSGKCGEFFDRLKKYLKAAPANQEQPASVQQAATRLEPETQNKDSLSLVLGPNGEQLI